MPHFVNAQRLARMYPESFEAYSYDELSNLTEGDHVKVCSNNERFWVLLTEVNGKKFKGKVNNHLRLNNLEVGDEVNFTMTNIFDFRKVNQK